MNTLTRTCFVALFSHWRRNPLQLITFLTGLAIATALWSGVQAINSEARASYDAAAATLDEGQFDQLLASDGNGVALSTYIMLRRNGWQVSPVIEGRLGEVRIIGIDPLTAPGSLTGVELNEQVSLNSFLGKGAVLTHPETTSVLSGKAFEQLEIVTNRNIAPKLAFTDISVAQRLLGQSDFSRLIVSNMQPLKRPDLSSIAPQLLLQRATQSADLGELTDSFHLNLTAFGLLSFAVGIFIVHGAIGLAFEQRRGTIRTLRALGVPLRRLTTLVACEILSLAFLGAMIGIALGYFVAAALLPDVAATLRGLYGADVTGQLSLRPEWWASGLAIAMLGAALAMAGKLFSIARMPVLASPRPRAWAIATGNTRRWQAASALLLAVLALALLAYGSGLTVGFMLQGCLLTAAALMLPLLLDRILSFIQNRSNGVVSHWFWADTRQQLPGLSLALMALLLAVAANIGVSTMVSSFRLTFVEFLDQRLAPELYINVQNEEQSKAMDRALSQNARETIVIMSERAEVAGLPVELEAMRVGATHRQDWKLLEGQTDAWDSLEGGSGVLANEQFVRRAGLWTGDDVELPNGSKVEVVGIVGDYGNPLGQLYISEKLFLDLFPDRFPLRFGARTDDPKALRETLNAEVGVPTSAMTDQAAVKEFSLQVFERTFTVTAALNVLTLSVAGFAMLMSLLTLADLRVPQLAPVWALGLTRRQLGRLELLRALALAATVCLLALPLGLALAWILLAIVNVEAFGWRLPMFLFPWDYTKLWFYAFCAALLAACWPALRLARTPPNALLKVFANER
ncbi:MAG: FtsX-like permease family protein [Pseudomonadota bacterium]